jgi:phosphate transport system substrate-binding protein
MPVRRALPVAALILFSAAACGRGPALVISVDGSSTVYPISEAMAEEFGLASEDRVHVTIATSGTGGGFKTFCAGERDISNASRPIKRSEAELCAENGVEYIELQVAIDGLSVVVNPANTFAICLTVAELKAIWEPGSTVQLWSEVRPTWPAEPIRLYGAGTNSGTFDTFTETIVGRTGAIRSDFSASEDDNVLVQGVEGDRNSLGFFGYAYYAENATRIRAVEIDGGAGCIAPTPETVRSGDYEPLARPLFIYVSRASWERPIVREFVRFYLAQAERYVPETGYVPLRAEEYATLLAGLDTIPVKTEIAP